MLGLKLILSLHLSPVLHTILAVGLNNLIEDLLQEYPSQPHCGLQYMSDNTSKIDSLSLTVHAHKNMRSVSLWEISMDQNYIPSMATFSKGFSKCEMVLIDVDQMLTIDLIKQIHSGGHASQSHFYAIKLEDVESLQRTNITEIYDFPHLIFLVDKVTMKSFPFPVQQCIW